MPCDTILDISSYSTSSNGDLQKNSGGSDLVIAKFSLNGDKFWLRSYGGSSTDTVYSVAAASDGGYVAVGLSGSSNVDLSGNKGSYDFIIAKFNASGNKVWIKNYGGSGYDSFYSVAATVDGGYVAAGHSSSSDGDLSGNRGGMDLVIARFDANGNKVWIRNYGGSKDGRFTSIVVTNDGSYIAVGESESSDGDLPGNKGGSDFIIAKFTPEGNLPLNRISGQNRHQTAVAAAKAAYPNGASTAIIANASNYPDALAASTLAGKVKAPILLSPKDKLDSDTQAELIRLKPTTVYIVGSTGAISTNVANQLKALSSVKTVKRLGGNNRFETAKLIADAAIGGTTTKVNEIYLVSGDNFPDALSVSSFSVITGIPILLTNHSKTSNEVISFINAHKVDKVTIIGGASAVSTASENYLKNNLHLTVVRLAGSDRYETAYQVITTLAKSLPATPKLIGIATGEMFADALSGGASLGVRGGILVLTSSKSLHAKTKTYLQTLAGAKPFIEILGGSVSISDGVQREVRGVFGY